ncbi:S-methyl-5'-thioadenosine phosphorylase [Victivallis sp. Marseille-Q1083]|uniref:S-methyl-5'-thioadenosine phosphorylase n=1 Tax=Victivallis sp. Marseille-Q1083 TaxID=2717288 RepID=UPI001C376C6E|nr:S-methyl-5'-thioadenosine phosphorylase [Victivallis sp. Marseille-Q1083]
MTKLGIIGGSGLYDIEGLEALHTQTLDTPFGTPSDQFTCGRLHDVEVVFLPRHGHNHTLLPHELNHRANIHAMKQLGVTHLLSISAVGSLTEEMRPRDVVIIDQYFDRTKRGGETQTFFGGGVAAHIAFGHPVCPELSSLAAAAAREAIAGSEAPDRRVFPTGTYVNIEGPAFSTQAESRFHRDNHLSVVGMTNLAEAKLAREAELCYCTVAMVTDYDCWHPDHDHVTVKLVVQNLTANVKLAKEIIRLVAGRVAGLPVRCPCPHALEHALITRPTAISAENRRKFELLIGKYL